MATRIDETFYLHVFDWPLSQRLDISSFPGKVSRANLLNGEALAFTQTGPQLEIRLPAQAPDPDVSVLVVDT